ncbi:hypothetical protein BOSEA31B_10465 [Hyphomicrobiales bacterium]|nr:hypothetical protein BOSEA31B_10465 [Hyphomicrobiales bacterium]CAH1700319.1 hypothetical protein BOSEA1005_20018 [Hyphomicrobiales bacterium]CAI0344200.1 hypothetical protein BO1005MUT1_320030 [Hyphomicrobiales bacterium]
MGTVMKLLARLFGRHQHNDAGQEKTSIQIREGDRVLSGRELYSEIAAKNAAEAAADMKAWNEKRDAADNRYWMG